MSFTPETRAYHWAIKLKSLSEDELHTQVSEHIHNLLCSGDTYAAIKTMSTFLLGYQLNIKLQKLWIYNRLMVELDRIITYCVHDPSMFVPYEMPENL